MVQDPGPYLLGVPYEMRQLVLDLIPPDVAIVDLDSNTVLIRSQYLPKAWGSSRSRKERRMLEGAIGKEEGPFGVPCLVMEAFPGGRFHSLSEVSLNGSERGRIGADVCAGTRERNWDGSIVSSSCLDCEYPSSR